MHFKNTLLPDTFSLNCNGRLLDISSPVVMGVINITDDSFYAGSRHNKVKDILQAAGRMLQEGASIIDIGAQSTRPGADKVTPQAEISKLIPVISEILHHFPDAIISADTYYSRVAEAAVKAGACIINDISAGNMDEEMIPAVAALRTPYIIMHMQGTPATMQENPVYEDILREISDFFIRKTEECRIAGIYDIIIDPGFGFGKTLRHNYTLLKGMSVFKTLERPLLCGLSRKSMIYRLLGITPEQALNGTTALHMLALQQGVNILRVHDVQPAIEAIRLWQFYSYE